jgi:hypothetical protein
MPDVISASTVFRAGKGFDFICSSLKVFLNILIPSCVHVNIYVALFVVRASSLLFFTFLSLSHHAGWKGLLKKGVGFGVTRNAFIKKHESILQRSQAFRGPAYLATSPACLIHVIDNCCFGPGRHDRVTVLTRFFNKPWKPAPQHLHGLT